MPHWKPGHNSLENEKNHHRCTSLDWGWGNVNPIWYGNRSRIYSREIKFKIKLLLESIQLRDVRLYSSETFHCLLIALCLLLVMSAQLSNNLSLVPSLSPSFGTACPVTEDNCVLICNIDLIVTNFDLCIRNFQFWIKPTDSVMSASSQREMKGKEV